MLTRTAVVEYPPMAIDRRRDGSSARAPPASLAAPAAPSEIPSINPRTEAGAPMVTVSRSGSSAVEISWPASEKKLARPMPATPGLIQDVVLRLFAHSANPSAN